MAGSGYAFGRRPRWAVLGGFGVLALGPALAGWYADSHTSCSGNECGWGTLVLVVLVAGNSIAFGLGVVLGAVLRRRRRALP